MPDEVDHQVTTIRYTPTSHAATGAGPRPAAAPRQARLVDRVHPVGRHEVRHGPHRAVGGLVSRRTGRLSRGQYTFGWRHLRLARQTLRPAGGIAQPPDDDVRKCPYTIVSSLMEAFYEYARQCGASILVLDVDDEPLGLERRERRFRKENIVPQTATRWWWRGTP